MVLVAAVGLTLLGVVYREIHQMVFLLGAFLLASGVLLEGYQLVNTCLATSVGKVAGALVATMVGALSIGISSVIVNQATGFSPSDFPYTVAFLAPLTAGHVLLLLTVVMFIVAPVVIMLLGVVSMWRRFRGGAKRLEVEYAKMLLRLFSAITLFSLIISSWNDHQKPYEAKLEHVASWFAYTFEMYGNDPCARNMREHVRRIEAGKALVGSSRNGERAFFVRRCEPRIFD